MAEGEEPGWVSPGAVPPPDPPAPPPYHAAPPYMLVPPPLYGPVPPAPQSLPVEELAVVALVLAVLSFLVPVVAGIAALVVAAMAVRRIRGAPTGTVRGRGLATAASIVAATGLLLWIGIAAVAVAVTVWQKDPAAGRSPTAAAVPSGREVDIGKLRVGDCVADQAIDTEAPVETVRVVPCWLPHDLEVSANATMAGDSYPGDEELSNFAERSCAASFERYVGAPVGDSRFDYFAYLPDHDTWDGGDHVVTCGVVDAGGGSLTGSARDAARS